MKQTGLLCIKPIYCTYVCHDKSVLINVCTHIRNLARSIEDSLMREPDLI